MLINSALALVVAISTLAIPAQAQSLDELAVGVWLRLGLHGAAVKPEQARELKLAKARGFLIDRVNGTAQKAGVKVGDVLFKIDEFEEGHGVAGDIAKIRSIAAKQAGAHVNLLLSRGGESMLLSVPMAPPKVASLKEGMTTQEVEDLLGPPKSSRSIDGKTVRTYEWITVEFTAGKVSNAPAE